MGKKDNPFNKKYLLSEKNEQLRNYAFYSSFNNYQLSEYSSTERKRANPNANKFTTRRENDLHEDSITEQVLKMTSNRNINVNKDKYPKQDYSNM